MKIKINGIHLDVGEALQVHVHDKLIPLVEKYFPNPIDATVNFSKRGNFFHADVAVHAKRGVHLNSTFEGDDVYVTFDQACTKMEKRLRRHKNKIRSHSKKHENQGITGHYIYQTTVGFYFSRMHAVVNHTDTQK